MTLETTHNRKDYVGDNVQVDFPYDFKILAAADLEVYVAGVLQTLTTHYTVSGVLESDGGDVTFVTAPGSAVTVLILRVVPAIQGVDLPASGPFPSKTVEEQGLDKLMMTIQQLNEESDRTIKMPKTSTVSGIDFPIPGASKYIRWRNDGLALEAVTPVIDSGNYLASGAGAVERTVSSKLGDMASVKDYGAVGDGTTDDTAAIQAAFDAFTGNGINGINVYFPAGKYLITSSIIIGDVPNVPRIHIYGAGALQAWILNASGDGAFVFSDLNSNKVLHLHDFAIENTANIGGGTYPYTIWCDTAASLVHFHDLWLRGEDFTGGGIYFENIEVVQLNNLLIRRFSDSATGHGIAMRPLGLDRGNIVVNTVKIASSGAFGGTGFKILDGVAGGWLHNLTFINFKTVGCAFGIVGPSGVADNITNVDIVGCHFEGPTKAIDFSNGGTLRCLHVRNTFIGRATTGIDLNKTRYADIQLNHVFDTSGTFLNVGSTDIKEIHLGKQYWDAVITNKLVDASGLVTVEQQEEIQLLGSGQTTPDVFGIKVLKTNNGGAPTTITSFVNPYKGQTIRLLIGDASTTIDFTGTNLKGNSGVDWTPALNDSMSATYDGTNWLCILSS